MSSRAVEQETALTTPSFKADISRRRFLQLTANAVVMTAAYYRRDLQEFFETVYPHDEFLQDAEALTDTEIEDLLEDHHEEPIHFDEQELDGSYFFQGTFRGNGSPVYLTFPAVYRHDPGLTVLDITANNRHIRTGIISSPDSEEKGVQLGPFPDSDKPVIVTIAKTFRGEDNEITADELQPRLSYPTNYTFRRLVDESVSFTLPRSGEPVWDDCLTKKMIIPYMQDGNYRFVVKKMTTAENSRYESLYEDYGRTYDDDWEMKLEVAPDGEIVQAFVSTRAHKTRDYDSNFFLFGTHPIVETYTDNNMVRPVEDFHWGMIYFADRPEVQSPAYREVVKRYKPVDPHLQNVSMDELRREGKDTDEIEDDMREKLSRRSVLFTRVRKE